MYKLFLKNLKPQITPQQIITDELLCLSYGANASPYSLTPKAVIFVKNNSEIISILSLANQYNIPITFKAAGTSLSGQASSDSVLIILDNNHWNQYQIINDGQQIKLECGIIGSQANGYLKKFGHKIGPDPASIDSCKIGGMVANNASGMCCGVIHNTYNTMEGMTFILPNGQTIDTLNQLSRNNFYQNPKNQKIISTLIKIKQIINNSSQLTDFITQKFAIKNTSGYSLNAFLDFDEPLDILSHLIIGSEGTLGFISNITYNTIEDPQYKATALIFIQNLHLIPNLIQKIKDHNSPYAKLNALELINSDALYALNKIAQFSDLIPKQFIPNNGCCLLVEISAINHQLLTLQIQIIMEYVIQPLVQQLEIYIAQPFTTDKITHKHIWNMRKSVTTVVGAQKNPDSIMILEDFAVHTSDLPQLIEDTKELIHKFNYANNYAIFGHALDGNLHFLITPKLNSAPEQSHYHNFMQELSLLIIQKFNGSLKAEHGVGRNMAPFIRQEWRDELYNIMWELKQVIDPNHILNPDVILTTNTLLDIEHLKQMQKVDSIIDQCIECGFCESICPSSSLSFSPRQRIVAYRSLRSNHSKLPKKTFIKKIPKYQMLDTCATTGLCATKCPVNINTANLVLNITQPTKTWANYLYANFATKYFAGWINSANKMIKYINLIAKLIGRKRLNHITQSLHKKYKIIPVYPISMPKHQTVKFETDIIVTNIMANNMLSLKNNNCDNYSMIDNEHSNNLGNKGNKENKENKQSKPKIIIYIPTCPNQLFAESKLNKAIVDNCNQKPYPYQSSILNIADHLGYTIIIPHNIKNLCCGQLLNNKSATNNIISEINQNGTCKNNSGASATSANHQQSFLLFQAIKHTVDVVLEQNSTIQHSDINVIIDNTSCYHHFSSQLFAKKGKIKIITSIEFIFNALPHLSLIQKFNNAFLHIDCSSIKLSLAEQIRQIVSKCTQNITEPDLINCCGFAGSKGFTIPELNQSAIQHMQIKPIPYDIGVSGNRNCQIGLTEYTKIDFISVAEMVSICLNVDLQESMYPLQFPHI